MKTTKSFATISYNTKDFLMKKLDDMFNLGRIEFYAFIYHYAEGEVAGVPELKDHIHLFIIPAEQIDTIQLKEEFAEEDPTNNLPLTIINCVRSKFYDWFHYAIHDPKYLASKFEERKFHYEINDLVTSDIDYLGQLLAMSDNNKLAGSEKFAMLVQSGLTFRELVCSGFVPIHLINQYRYAYELMSEDITFKNGIEYKQVADELDLEPVVDGKHGRKVFSTHEV